MSDAFCVFIAGLGYEPPARIVPGRWCPFSANGKRGNRSGRAMLFPDLEGGYVHDWITGETWNWQAKREQRSEAEHRAWLDRIARAREESEAERKRAQEAAAKRARNIWNRSNPASADHPYLLKKKIKPHGARLSRGALVVPVCNGNGEIRSLEFIWPDKKRGLTDGERKGNYFSFGEPGDTILICEGFSTGASLRDATGHYVVATFGKKNLEPVARLHRTKYPEARIGIGGDNDADGGGQAMARQAADAVGGTVVIPDGRKDWNDIWVFQGVEAVRRAVEQAWHVSPLPSSGHIKPGQEVDAVARSSSNDGGRRTQTTRIVELAMAEEVDLWHTAADEPYITFKVERDGAQHREHHRLRGQQVRDWLARLSYVKTGRSPGGQAVRDALSSLAGEAIYAGKEHDVHVRVAPHAGRIYLDLGRPDWNVAEVTAAGWTIISDPPVRMRRPKSLLALPLPAPGGSLEPLMGLLHIKSDTDWKLIASWLIGALRPSGPYPLLALAGEQGSSKSTTARMLRRLIDPASAALRGEPREVVDLMVAASHTWIIALDNVSHLPPWLSDALCRLSTGGALTKRELYTDGDEYIIDAMRPVILTGITDIVQRGDLQDRAISITLPPISESARRSEAELLAKFEQVAPGILGALLDAVVMALKGERVVQIQELPRMADYARWVTAAEPALGWPRGSILNAYSASRQDAVERGLEEDQVAVAVMHMALPWEGTASQLLGRLTPDGRPPAGWPQNPRRLSNDLRRLAPQLRSVGINLEFDLRQGHGGHRIIRIEKVPAPSATSASSAGTAASMSAADVADRADDADDDLGTEEEVGV